ncbi:MAG: hypothetical protein PHX08_03880 [Lachnospiraceae bacterium]|nr:hypothetical protein [Lachnospiraceae bacterium]
MIKVVKTNELIESEWKQLTDGFNICFHTNHSAKHLQKYYCNTILGYSYHALDINEDGVLRGYNSFVPFEYIYKNRVVLGGISGGTYVLPEYRNDVFIFMELMSSLFKHCKNEGMVLKLGVPNINSFKYTIKINKAKLVGYLNYYILPIRPFNIPNIRYLTPLNYISLTFSWGVVSFAYLWSLLVNNKPSKRLFEINTTQDFYDVRFNDTEKYQKIEEGNFFGYYRVCEEKNSKIVYIMEFREEKTRSLKSLLFMVKHILKYEKDVAAIMFIGTMNMRQPLLFKLPFRFEPKHLPLTVNIFNNDKQMLDEAVNMNSWDFSLINFDAR